MVITPCDAYSSWSQSWECGGMRWPGEYVAAKVRMAASSDWRLRDINWQFSARSPARLAATMAEMPNNIRHFSINADALPRARRFYEKVFGWKFQPWGPPGFFLIQTGDEKEPGIQGSLQ